MPEIKHNFTGGKMNKDLDERLIPNGEYTDAMNIQVSTSEGSEVGTVQNILGNKEMDYNNSPASQAVDGGVVVSSIADEKNDKLYYFVWTPNADYVLEYSRDDNTPKPVLVDINKDTLKFRPETIITGINIIDDMLFWTDNNSEPKKINIQRCKQGTTDFLTQTKLVNESQHPGASFFPIEDIKEKHITVIKKAPRKPLNMVVNSHRDITKIYTGVITISTDDSTPNSFIGSNPPSNFSGLTTEEGSNIFNIKILNGIDSGGNQIGLGSINGSSGLTGWHTQPNTNQNAIAVGTKIVFKPFDDDGDPPGLPVTDYVIKGVVMDSYPDTPFTPATPFVPAFTTPTTTTTNAFGITTTFGGITFPAIPAAPASGGPNTANTWNSGITVKILAIDGFPPAPGTDGASTLDYVVDLFDEEEKLFEFKFPRFSYRYKYEDGEYSPFAPFTQVAFLPGSFDYHPRKGYNLGMTNRAFEIELSRVVTSNTPKDVVSIDILFKDEPSPNIYVVDTIRPNEFAASGTLNKWNQLVGDWENGVASMPYVIRKETIQSVVPSNQLLRPWDNVPRRALAQDVTGNRIVYGNYVQNYDLKTIDQKDYTPNFTIDFDHADITIGDSYFKEDGLETVTKHNTNSSTAKSIKSLREYQLGVVFTDKYGRETPVISNNLAILKLEKDMADRANSIKVMLNDFASKPEGLTHLKFFVKETSGEYYNMAMDRFYDAEDGNVWLSFPSSDRNKIDIDTFLILKKGADQDTLVSNAARYKVIAIENEAPDFIKTTRVLAASKKHTAGSGNDLFTDAGLGIPVIGKKEFKMEFKPWGSGPGRNLDKISDADLYVEFTNGSQFSNRYKIASITNDEVLDADGVVVTTGGAFYSIQLEEVLGEDVNFISNDITGATSTSITSGAIVNIYKYKVENKPQFDGRFFVKIHEDDVFLSNIGVSFIEGLEYRTKASKKVYSMKPSVEHLTLHWGDTDKMLTNGNGPNFPITTNNAHSFWWDNGNPHNSRQNHGYYRIDEFASMATYFRKYRKGTSSSSEFYNDVFGLGINLVSLNDIRQLVPTNATSADEEYPTGSYWKDHTSWESEYGKFNQGGYTARWENYSALGSRWAKETRFVGADDPIHTDVWFIDAGPAAAKRSTNDNLSWNYLSPNSLSGQGTNHHTYDEMGYEDRSSNPGGHENQAGLVDSGSKWNMQLSYGGIFGSEGDTDNFFNIGGFAGSTSSINPYYTSNPKNTNFVQSVDSGAQFRWREDPTGTVYTLSPSISQKRLLRHSARRNEVVYRDGALAPGWSGGAVSMAEDLSFNFTSGWNLRNITPAMTWNPVQVGKISNGLEVTLKAANSSGSTTSGGSITCTDTGITVGDLSIYVSSLVGTNTVGDDATIHVGMALEQYTKNENGAVQQSINHGDNLGTSAEEFLVVREIIKMSTGYELKLGGYSRQLQPQEHALQIFNPKLGSDLVFVQVGMNGYSHNSEFNINTIGREHNDGCVGAVGYTLDFVEYIDPEPVLSENPAIWETEPKDIKELDIYYEASPTIPMIIDASNVHDAVPIGSVIQKGPGTGLRPFLVIDHNDAGGIIVVDGNGAYSGYSTELAVGNNVIIARPDGLTFKSVISTLGVFGIASGNIYALITLDEDLYTKEFKIPYHNCYSFGNGVESNRIRDNFNLPFITNGVKVSTTLEYEYEEEHRKYGLIYSGIYNSVSGVNNLNQFVAAESITKDINPIYGSIQKLHSGWGQGGDLIALCEDRVLKILADKDALFNADGNTNVTATNRVLGQAVAYSGDYGISTNPESFASEAYRAYFTDRVRGTVMRLSMDGLTPISNHGMKDWFRDNLKLNNTAFGSYDDKKEEYNLTLSNKRFGEVEVIGFSKNTTGGPYEASTLVVASNFIASQISVGDNIIGIGIPPTTTAVNKVNLGGGKWKIELSSVMDESLMGSYHGYGNVSSNQVAWRITIFMPADYDDASTISFKEDVKGWVSFKSFVPENALSMANDYYTFKDGGLWKHHDETVDRNTFYGEDLVSSSVEVVLNDSPSSIKDFHTLNYEGSQSKIDLFVSEGLHIGDPFQPNTTYNDQEIYNLSAKDGWYVEKIFTDKEEGYVNEFIEKEGKWYNNINRKIDISLDSADTADFTFQGIGIVGAVPGCTDPLATNYDPTANVNDGSCIFPVVPGCTDPIALNYDPTATVDDGTCAYPAPVLGCTDLLALNYDASATVDDGSCTYDPIDPDPVDPVDPVLADPIDPVVVDPVDPVKSVLVKPAKSVKQPATSKTKKY